MAWSIFGQLDWLTTRVKRLCCAVDQIKKEAGPVVDVNGNVIIANTSSKTVNVAGGDSQYIPNFSGMLLVNDHYDGSVELWICGGGNSTVLVDRTPYGPGPGDLIIDGGVDGYRWKNQSNAQGPFTFTVIKTRENA